MLTKTLLCSVITGILVTSLSGCGGGGADGSDIANELKTPDTSGTQGNDGLISQRNFLIEFSEVAPAFLDLAANTTTATTSDVTVKIADNNNQIITAPKTIFFETEWGFIEPSCTTDNTGSCSVTWSTGDITDTNLIGFKNTIVAYSSKSGETGQESFFDANGNGSFNDGETANDVDEPFIDRDDSLTFNTGDKVIDTINGVDTSGTNALHDAGDGLYNGPDCSHSTLCSTIRAVNTVWNSGSLQLTGADTFTIGGTISGLAPGDTITLQNNGGDNIILTSTATSFTFGTPQTPGTLYKVTILTQATAAVTCTVTPGTGSGIAGNQLGGNITTVVVGCI